MEELGGTGGYAPTPCPQGEYRASDGRCYTLPTPPPEQCPTSAYRASDGKCYPLTPGQPVGDCPGGYLIGTDGVCRPSTACPAGYEYSKRCVYSFNNNMSCWLHSKQRYLCNEPDYMSCRYSVCKTEYV